MNRYGLLYLNEDGWIMLGEYNSLGEIDLFYGFAEPGKFDIDMPDDAFVFAAISERDEPGGIRIHPLSKVLARENMEEGFSESKTPTEIVNEALRTGSQAFFRKVYKMSSRWTEPKH